jgi:hypothetical protein
MFAGTDSFDGVCCFGLQKKVYTKVSGLASWSKDCKWQRSLPLGAVVIAIL